MERIETPIALLLLIVYGGVAFGWRVWAQYSRTGDAGLRFVPRTAADRAAGAALVASVIAAVLAPLADLFGWLPRYGALDRPPAPIAGGAAFLAGFVLTVRAQLDLGDAWRIGVDPDEATPLVTAGVFRRVRNPVFSGIALAFAGLLLLVPNAAAVAAWILLAVGLQIQVRRVEEPHLRRLHGDRYTDYAAAAGRFIPGLGRLRR